MKNTSPFFILVAFLVHYNSASYSQQTKFVSLNKYTQNEGLSSYFVTKILKDSFGFMWIGTQEGLNLFDGRRFVVFSKQEEEKRKLGGSFIEDILEDRKRNLLWVLTSYGNICGIDLQTRAIKYRINSGRDNSPLSTKWIRCLALQGDILYFAGLSIAEGFNIETGKYITKALSTQINFGNEDCNISKIIVDKVERLWFFCDGDGVVILDRNLFNVQRIQADQLAVDNKQRKLRFWNTCFFKNELYVGTSWGLRVFDANKNLITCVKNFSNSIIDSSEVLSLAFDANGQLYISTPGAVRSYNFKGQKLENYSDLDPDDDWLSLTYQIFHDSISHKLWIGTQSGLASFEVRPPPFSFYSKSNQSTIKIKHAFSLLPITDNEVFCGDENGLFYIRTDIREIKMIDNQSSNLLLFKDQKSNIFLSNKSGFFVVDGLETKPVHTAYPSMRKMESDHFNSALQLNDSLLLFGSVLQKGLYVWNNKSGQIKIYHKDSTPHKLNDLSIINNLFKDKNNNIFILTEKSIIKFDPLSENHQTFFISENNSQDPIVNFMDMCEMNGFFWIATYGDGILQTDKNFSLIKKISVREGLSNNCVYKVFPSNNKAIIATTNYGLSIVNANNSSIQTYFQSDGLHSSQFEQVCGQTFGRKIYAGGVNGFSVIDPEMLSSNQDPPLMYITNISIKRKSDLQDTSDIFLKELKIPNDVVQVTIFFSGLSFKNPARTTYAYKINNDQGSWIEIGTQNFINLPPLPPGKYALLFRACNESGVYTTKPVSLILQYLPKWYQTLLFKVFVFLAISTLIYSFYRFRLLQYKRQQEIRKEIASDLHDDIGSILNSVKIFTHLAKREPENPEHLEQIEDSLMQASLGLRDMIWVLDDDRDTIYEVMERITNYAVPVCQAKKIKFEHHVETDSTGFSLTKTEKRNLLLIAKEAINNSIKYANCTSINVVAKMLNQEVLFSIHDDGTGFDLGASEGKGQGLRNIQQRARQINLSASFKSSEKGTTVIIANHIEI